MRIVLRFLVLMFILLPTVRVLALSPEQKEAFDAGAEYFNIEEGTCSPSNATLAEPSAALESGSTVYILGDSITNQSRAAIETAMAAAPFTISAINSDPGRAISVDTAGGNPTGLQAVAADAALIAGSDAVVVALGTNSGTEDLSIQIPALVTAIKTAKPDLPTSNIFWLNLFYESGGADLRNAVISQQSTALGFRIINTIGESIELGTDKVHPTVAGSTTFATTIVKGLKNGGSTQVATFTAGSGFDPLSLGFPAFPNEAEVGPKITAYLLQHKPSTPWLGVAPDFGVWLMQEAKTRNINPLLIMTMGRQENGFGTSDSVHVRQYFNYFGMKGTTPIDIPNSEYRGFSSPAEGLMFMMDKIKENTQGPDKGYYKDVTNYYEYQSMHQSGSIKYPGEPLGNQGPTGQDGYDSAMRVYTSWTTTDHPNDAYDGNLYNPGIYFKNSVGLINAMLGLTLSDIPVRGGSGIVLNCQTSAGASGGGSGLVNPLGYSFPLAPQTKFVGGIDVGQTATKHHDRSAAFDLFSTDSADVYAIFGGVATNINTSYHNITGCSTIQFKANDGFYYWYGHMKNVTIQQNVPIAAGEKIGQIADNRDFGSDCWGGGPHLHIDRGCVIDNIPQTGGRDECRDPDFIPFLAAIYEGLPE